MDPKELRANATLTLSVNDDSTKYVHSSPTLSATKNKSYHEIGSNAMGKVDATAVRPYAVIGPDRVLPQTAGDVYLKKTPVEPWASQDNTYRQPPDYPNKLSEYGEYIRNISPRQTFQENMQRVMVPPTYSSIKNSDDSNLKNTKLNMPQEAKYCDVPYNMTSVTNEHKSVRNSDIPISSVNPSFGRSVPHYGWPAVVNIQPPRPYGAPEFYQYPEYPSYVGPRPVTITRPHRVHREEAAQVYSERLYQEANIRFKPYPIAKGKHQQTRYDYINNYTNTFHPPVSFPPHKSDLQKTIHNHHYPVYPHVATKYLDRRVHETFVDGFPRPNQQPSFNQQFHNQVIQPQYGPVSGNCVQNKPFPDLSVKSMSNKLSYEANNKIYLDLDTSRSKGYPLPENVYYNDTNHSQHMRSEILLPNHSPLNMHSMPHHQIYRRDMPLKHYEYNPHYRNLDQGVNLNYALQRLPLQYSPNAIAISPSDSNTSNDTTHTIGTSQEDCGYVSQSSTNSMRSLDTGNISAQKDIYRRQDYNINAIAQNVLHNNGPEKIPKTKTSSSNKKNIDVRQFLQMWNEGEDEANESNKETVTQNHVGNFPMSSQTINNQEQLYVLGLVNVPNEELSKYEHIQKISKLPENIKGYNSIELLNQYEELLESPNSNNYKVTPKLYKDHNTMTLPKRSNNKENITVPRPISPLDVEAKISQSVIHKEVGCNFEIKPCSPEMLNVEVATPLQSILGERIIEKVTNPMTSKSPMLPRNDDSKTPNSGIINTKISSCDMMNKQCAANNYINIPKTNNYNVQDFESNSGVCLASLPRLDNDIELNFPEINQQFIKANKIESDGQLSQKALFQLNSDQNKDQERDSFQQQNGLSPQICLGSASEKEFSKLSKYRKNKKCDLMPKEVTVQQRIDSVIIKNPDTKLQEDNDVSFSSINKDSSESIDINCNTEESPEKNLSLEPEKRLLTFETAIDFSLNKTEETISYDSLDKCVDETHSFGDSYNINLSSGDIINNETIAKEKSIELYTKQIREEETIKEGVIINNEHIELSKIEINENNTYELPLNDSNEENIPVIKNVLNVNDIEECVDLQENETLVKMQMEIALETNLKSVNEIKTTNLESVNAVNFKNDVMSTIITDIRKEESPLLENVLETTESKCEIKTELKEIECKTDTISQNQEKNDDNVNDESCVSETSDKFNESIEFPDRKKLLIVSEKDINIVATIKNTTTENILSKEMETEKDEKNIMHDVISTDTVKEMNTVLDDTDLTNIEKRHDDVEIEEKEMLNLTTNSNKIESKPFSTENLTLNNQLGVVFKSRDDCHDNDDIVSSEINYSPNAHNQETNINEAPSKLTSIISDSDDDNKICSQFNNRDRQNHCANKISTNDVIESDKFSIRKTIKVPADKENYTYIAKELYSPWIQKLLMFAEGICTNLQIEAVETIKEKILSNTPINNSFVKDGDKKLNKDVEIENIGIAKTRNVENNLTNLSENYKNEENNILGEPIKIQENVEGNDNILSRDLNTFSEDSTKCSREENESKPSAIECASIIRRNVLKRSLSESALEDYKDDENIEILAPSKRKKGNHNIIQPIISEDLCNIIQTNRRNSISTFYNEDNVFILIDNDLIITEDNEDSGKMYYTEITDDFTNITRNESEIDNADGTLTDEITSIEPNLINDYSNNLHDIEQKRDAEESWVEDIACIETVVSDNIIEDIDYEAMSPKKSILVDETIRDESALFCDSKHIDKIKSIYGSNMCNNDTQILQTLYMTPQMDVNKTLVDIESHNSVEYQGYNKILNYSFDNNDCLDNSETDILSYDSCEIINEKENISSKHADDIKIKEIEDMENDFYVSKEEKEKCIVHSCESNNDHITESPKRIDTYSNSSSPEVSSTTSEEKNSSILLKITNHNGSRVSQINEICTIDRLSYKLTEKKDYNTNFSSSRTLITKAAQKYIPPLKETIRDLKIKLTLPQHRLHTLKQLKISKVEPKIDNNVLKYNNKNVKKEVPKKQKPKFEDVLKSIDEIQFKKHRERVKKGKNGIPKVVIKKSENGAHYASSKTSNNEETYNPDLTGRKWQPWVFLEKNSFIDKMAIKKKVKAVYCHRKNNFVLAEKFRKYKSIYNANFVISQPCPNNSEKGNLKYTIRLKHK